MFSQRQIYLIRIEWALYVPSRIVFVDVIFVFVDSCFEEQFFWYDQRGPPMLREQFPECKLTCNVYLNCQWCVQWSLKNAVWNVISKVCVKSHFEMQRHAVLYLFRAFTYCVFVGLRNSTEPHKLSKTIGLLSQNMVLEKKNIFVQGKICVPFRRHAGSLWPPFLLIL